MSLAGKTSKSKSPSSSMSSSMSPSMSPSPPPGSGGSQARHGRPSTTAALRASRIVKNRGPNPGAASVDPMAGAAAQPRGNFCLISVSARRSRSRARFLKQQLSYFGNAPPNVACLR
jgi:hypothetical protein